MISKTLHECFEFKYTPNKIFNHLLFLVDWKFWLITTNLLIIGIIWSWKVDPNDISLSIPEVIRSSQASQLKTTQQIPSGFSEYFPSIGICNQYIIIPKQSNYVTKKDLYPIIRDPLTRYQDCLFSPKTKPNWKTLNNKITSSSEFQKEALNDKEPSRQYGKIENSSRIIINHVTPEFQREKPEDKEPKKDLRNSLRNTSINYAKIDKRLIASLATVALVLILYISLRNYLSLKITFERKDIENDIHFIAYDFYSPSRHNKKIITLRYPGHPSQIFYFIFKRLVAYIYIIHLVKNRPIFTLIRFFPELFFLPLYIKLLRPDTIPIMVIGIVYMVIVFLLKLRLFDLAIIRIGNISSILFGVEELETNLGNKFDILLNNYSESKTLIRDYLDRLKLITPFF